MRGRPFLLWSAIVTAALALALTLAPRAEADGTVAVSVQGKGGATGTGIDCTETGGPDCSEFYPDDQVQICNPELKPPCHFEQFPPTIELTAAERAGSGFAFDSWSGCDSVGGTGGRTCTLAVNASTTVRPRFVDVANPTVSALSPSGGVQQGTITLGATASDNAGVARVEFRVRGALVATDTIAPYSATFNTASVSDGAAALSATAVDTAGRASSIGSSVTIDNNAPALAVTSGPNGQTFGPGSTQTWTFSASDATLASVQCSLVAEEAAPSFGACSGGNGSHSVSNRPDGSYTFTVRASDAAGFETTESRTFAIDATPPETTIDTGPADGSSSSSTTATFTFSATQPDSTFQCRVYQAALTPGPWAACSGDGTHTATGFTPGTYTFEVVATDPFGNVEGAAAKRTFTVTAPPNDGGGDGGDGSGGGGGSGDGGAGGGTASGGTAGGGASGGDGTAAGPSLVQVAAALKADVATAVRRLQRMSLAKLRRKRRVVVRLRSLGPGRFTLKLAGKARRGSRAARSTMIAKGTRKVRAGGRHKLVLRLTKKGRRALRRAGRLRGKLTVRFVDSAGRAVVRSKRITLKRR